jgi:hypothetical protein
VIGLGWHLYHGSSRTACGIELDQLKDGWRNLRKSWRSVKCVGCLEAEMDAIIRLREELGK